MLIGAMRGVETLWQDEGSITPELVLVCPELRSRYTSAEFHPRAYFEAREATLPEDEPRRARAARRFGPPVALASLLLALAGGDRLGARPSDQRPAAAPAERSARGEDVVVGGLISATVGLKLSAPAPRSRPHRKIVSPPVQRSAPRSAPRPAEAPSEVEPQSGMLGPLPDPTPRHMRLAPATARELLTAARRRHVDWAMLAAAVRSNGSGWPDPRARAIRKTAAWLSRGRGRNDDGLLVLAQYDRAVGIDALIGGLEGAKSVLGAQVLRDPRISMYAGGQRDIAAGRVDPRVLSLLLFLGRRTGEVTVSSLVSGHPTPTGGGRSAHAFGAAVEVSALGGRPVAGQQDAGGLVDRTIQAMLLLPREVRPKQITSLIDLGGPAVALTGYREHIQISFDPTAQPVDELHVLWQLAASRYGVPWRVLAAINEIESHNGRLLGPSLAGAVGWMQFLPSTWRQYGLDANGDGQADPANPADAIFSAARYLAAAGASTDIRRAIYAYNHADWYVNDVLRLAGSIGS
jgi:hypothetical protein